MSEECCPPDDNSQSTDALICPACENEAQPVPHDTLYHQLKPFVARDVSPERTYRVCQTRSCPVLYFSSDHGQTFESHDNRTLVGFKQPEDESPHPVCYCFGYTKENIAGEIDETGESTVVDWISERVQNDECACEYKNPTGRCCLGNIRETVNKSLRESSQQTQ